MIKVVYNLFLFLGLVIGMTFTIFGFDPKYVFWGVLAGKLIFDAMFESEKF